MDRAHAENSNPWLAPWALRARGGPSAAVHGGALGSWRPPRAPASTGRLCVPPRAGRRTRCPWRRDGARRGAAGAADKGAAVGGGRRMAATSRPHGAARPALWTARTWHHCRLPPGSSPSRASVMGMVAGTPTVRGGGMCMASSQVLPGKCPALTNQHTEGTVPSCPWHPLGSTGDKPKLLGPPDRTLPRSTQLSVSLSHEGLQHRRLRGPGRWAGRGPRPWWVTGPQSSGGTGPCRAARGQDTGRGYD